MALLILFQMTLSGFPSPSHNKNYAYLFYIKKIAWNYASLFCIKKIAFTGVCIILNPALLKCLERRFPNFLSTSLLPILFTFYYSTLNLES